MTFLMPIQNNPYRTTPRHSGAILAVALLFAGSTAVFGQVLCAGLRAGQSTRLQAERILGAPVRGSEYKPLSGSGPIRVTYDAEAGMVSKIEVALLNPAPREDAVAMMKLTQTPVLQQDSSGRLIEYFGPRAFVAFTYAAGEKESGVTAIQCFSPTAFPRTANQVVPSQTSVNPYPPGPASAVPAPPEGFGALQTNTTLQGETLRYFGGGQTHESCQSQCARDGQCRGFTYVRADGYSQGDPPVCYLLSKVTGQVTHKCCVSSVKK